MKKFRFEPLPEWCPGCPNFGILNALKTALMALGKRPHECCLVSGIGQAAKLPHYLKCNFFNGLHGRALPAALGIHVANPHLTTIVVTGDGDCYGEGGNHFLHALRRNPDITVVVHNNGFYALTKGQASPTTKIGEKRSLQIHGKEGVYLIKPNIRKFRELVRKEIKEESQIQAAARKMVKSGRAEVLVISLGAAGALMVSEEITERILAPTVPIVSKVGAGDSMVAGIVLSLARGKTLWESVLFGVAAGAAAVMTPGTELCRKEDVERLFKSMASGSG